MATKVDKSINSQENTIEKSELEILFPDRQINIGGKNITVRELRFAEQLRWQSILNKIAESFDGVDVENVNFFENALAILGFHAEELLEIVAFCCEQSKEWIESLPASQGEELLITWWTVNNSFFVRRLLRKGLIEKVTQAKVGN